MKYWLLLLGSVAVLFAGSAGVCEEKLTSRDFGYGFMLNLQGEGAVYSLEVPREVYTRVRRADLGDIRVFNGTGDEVPHTLRSGKEENVKVVSDVPFFPLYKAETGSTDLSLSVRRDADGTIIDLDSSQSAKDKEAEPEGYLLDLGEESEKIGSLEIFWRSDPTHASASIKLEQSTDLQRWFPLVRRSTLVDLEYAGNKVVQRTVQLPGRPERYLKISWLTGSAVLPVTKVSAGSDSPVSQNNLQWASLYNGKKGTVNGAETITYASNAYYPVSSARLRFTDQNSIMRVSLQSREAEEHSWRERCRGIFYSINIEGQNVQSEPCSFEISTDNQWRLVVLDDGAGLSQNGGNVMVDLGWQSDELLFLARGTPPFLLAYGSGKLEKSEKTRNSELVLSAVKQQGDRVVKKARPGKRIELGGEAALVPPPPPKPWKTWLLWGVLVAGVITMGVMAASLVRDFRESGAND